MDVRWPGNRIEADLKDFSVENSLAPLLLPLFGAPLLAGFDLSGVRGGNRSLLVLVDIVWFGSLVAS